jgi:hypothetical protein
MADGRPGPPARRPCGTTAALRRHKRRGEPPCEACLQADRREHSAAAGTHSPETREKRNGIPWKPYVYRGTGYDQTEEAC